MVIGICDDEIRCAEETMECCEKVKEMLQQEFEYQIFNSGEQLLKYKGDIDILFIDIEMKGISGVDTMKILEDKNNIKNIFFVSAHSDYVFDTFGVKTRGFICKPIEFNRFLKEIKKVVGRRQDNTAVEISVCGKKAYISVDSILYFSGEDKYVRMVTEDNKYLVNGSLREWESKLSEYHFARVHKSYLVNLKYVSDIRDVVKLISGKEQLPVGRKYRETSRRLYKEYTLKRFRGRTND